MDNDLIFHDEPVAKTKKVSKHLARVRLLQVIAAILTEPAKYNQDTFCATDRCIAGWLVFLNDGEKALKAYHRAYNKRTKELGYAGGPLHHGAFKRSQELLGIEDDDVMLSLCGDSSDWPSEFRAAWDAIDYTENYVITQVQGDRIMAEIGANRIKHFIKEHLS